VSVVRPEVSDIPAQQMAMLLDSAMASAGGVKPQNPGLWRVGNT
jgi:hypothetical protein